MSILTAVLISGGSCELEWLPGDLRTFAVSAPAGVYTVTRTYHGDQFVLLEAHLDRLEQLAQLQGIACIRDERDIIAGLRDLLERAGFPDSRVRIGLRGSHPDPLDHAVDPLIPIPAELKTAGVAVATIQMVHRNPLTKTTAWERKQLAAMSSLPEGCYEGLLVHPDGTILEGFTSNFFSVCDGKLYPAQAGILHGILAPHCACGHGRPASDNCGADPAGRDRSNRGVVSHQQRRGVVPIVKIGGQIFGDGKPGRWTAKISHEYNHWVEENMQPIDEYLLERRASQ